MTMINCPECGHKVSGQAYSCPDCGYQLKKPYSAQITGKAAVYIVLGIISIPLLPFMVVLIVRHWFAVLLIVGLGMASWFYWNQKFGRGKQQ